MLNLKKTAVAVLALGSSAVFAGTMGPVCSAVNVTVPCESTAWDFGGKALYLQPAVAGAGIGTKTTFTALNGNTVTAGQNPNYSWGFMLEGSYHFNTGNDLNLNWYHVHRSNSRSTAAFGPIVNDIPGLSDLTTSGGVGTISASPHWDAVNLEFGQHVDFGENKSIRFHGGAEYARLTGNSSVTGTTTTTGTFAGGRVTATDLTVISTNNPTYNGFGPRVGADMAYDWGNGLGFYANGAAALLAGSSKFTAVNTIGTATTATAGGTTTGSATIIVPELEGKLGATYTYAMAQGDLTLDAGWMWINYFNAVQTSGNDITDFGLQGPFIGLKWLGNVA
ncbi:Lpg1974 family pore-forming outer membrane protein [bacterium]|nr:Lpg1974 family pore-forming outer membrane protein [bacterium]